MDINMSALLSQIALGLINGSFYALLCLGLSIIFGMLFVINFAHGAQFMMGAMVSWILLNQLGVGFWASLIISPLLVGGVGVLIERFLLRRTYRLDHIFALLLTVGIATVIEGVFFKGFGAVGKSYPVPAGLTGVFHLGFMVLPKYRVFVFFVSVVVCIMSWWTIEKTSIGSYLRAATERPELVRAFGINVPVLFTLTYAFAVALAALAGVLMAPIQQIGPFSGAFFMDAAFATVVIGGMGSLGGAIITGFLVGFLQGLALYFYPEGAHTVVFFLMVAILVFRPMGLFGRTIVMHPQTSDTARISLKDKLGVAPSHLSGGLILLAALLILPNFVYQRDIMAIMVMALFAASLNLSLGYGGLMSFGHAMFFGTASYVAAHALKVWGLTPELSIIAAVVAASLLGLAVGALAIRRKAIYFAMITLACSQIVLFLSNQFKFTGGEDGIQRVPTGRLFNLIDLSDITSLYLFVVGMVLLGLLATYRVVYSPFGHILRSIRDNEDRAVSLGYDTRKLRLIAFVLSAGLAGLAGALQVFVTQIATLAGVSAEMSGNAIFMTLIGGIGTVFGPVAGALVVTGMDHFLAGLGTWLRLIKGLVFVACVVLFRQGIIGQISKIIRRPL